MVKEPEITDEWVLKDTTRRLRLLLTEEKEDKVKKEIRDKSIVRLKLLYEEYSNGRPFEEHNVDSQEIRVIGGIVDNKISKTKEESTQSKFEYPVNGTWAERIVSIFKHKNRVLKIGEVVEAIRPHEPKYTDKQLVNLISNTVNMTLVKKDILKIYKPVVPTKGFYYGSPLWWDNGNLKEEHMFIKKETKIWE